MSHGFILWGTYLNKPGGLKPCYQRVWIHLTITESLFCARKFKNVSTCDKGRVTEPSEGRWSDKVLNARTRGGPGRATPAATCSGDCPPELGWPPRGDGVFFPQRCHSGDRGPLSLWQALWALMAMGCTREQQLLFKREIKRSTALDK